jgi:hypothetical protein
MDQAPSSPAQSVVGAALPVAIDLQGELSCARCGYELKGLSITVVCPECGVPVRATILARVDPQADELQPLFFPRITAWGMVLWTSAALLATVVAWLLKAEDLGVRMRLPAGLHYLVPGLALVSGLGAAVMVRPHPLRAPGVLPRPGLAGTRTGSILAFVGVACHVPLAVALYHAYVASGAPAEASLARLMAIGWVIVILACLRPNARLLAARSFLMRTGQIDRQQMASLIALLLVQALGESLRLLTLRGQWAHQELLTLLAEILVMAGASLFTLGLVSMWIDTLRLRRVLSEPPLSLRKLVG